MTNEFFNDYRLLLIIMFIFTLANWYLLIVIIARGLKRISNEIEELKENKKWKKMKQTKGLKDCSISLH